MGCLVFRSKLAMVEQNWRRIRQNLRAKKKLTIFEPFYCLKSLLISEVMQPTVTQQFVWMILMTKKI